MLHRRTIGWTEAAFASSGMVGLSCRRSVTPVVTPLAAIAIVSQDEDLRTMLDHLENPYRSPTADCGPVLTQHAGTLIDSGWLYRKVQLPHPFNTTIEYNGRGFGFESVLVDGQIVARQTSLLWYVPHFDFVVPTKSGDLAGSIDVRVAPWLTLSHIVVRIEGKEVYAEP